MSKTIKKLLGITDTVIGNITKSKYTPKFISKPLQSVQSYAQTVVKGRNDYQPKARELIKKYGDYHINNIEIIRQPIQSFINTAFNALTFGEFQKKLDTLPYDKLFHLRMVVTLDNNIKLQIEKNEVINITTKIDKVKGEERANVPLMKQLTLNQLLEGGKSVLKDQYFSYRAFGNNCQDYQLALLKGSGLLTKELENFIKQDVSELANINPYLKKIANTFTDLGGKFNEIIYGTGIHKKHNKTYKVQSVVFDKKHWNVKDARKWLNEHNYIASKVDRKLNTLRFRQLDPDDYDRSLWKYTTHKLPNSVDLIIIYKIKKSNSNNMKKSKGGDLVHIDINSHNMKGKKIDLDKMDDEIKGGKLINVTKAVRTSNKPMEDFTPMAKKIISSNRLLNNLTTDDIRDLKKLFSEIGEEEIKKKDNIKKVRKASIKRVKMEVKNTKKASPMENIKGTIEGKRKALSKYKKK
jgi:hypothetical protein